MQKLWYASFVPVRAIKAKNLKLKVRGGGFFLVRTFFGLCCVSFVMAQGALLAHPLASPSPPSPGSLQAGSEKVSKEGSPLLSLPLLEAQWIESGQAVPESLSQKGKTSPGPTVGDELILQLTLPESAGQPLWGEGEKSNEEVSVFPLPSETRADASGEPEKSSPTGKKSRSNLSLEEQGWNVQVIQPSQEKPKRQKTQDRSLDDPDLSLSSSVFLRVIPLKPGSLVLPPLVLKKRGGKNRARTEALSLSIRSAIQAQDPKPQEAEGIVPPVGLNFPWWVILIMGLFVIGLTLGIFYGFYRVLRRRAPGRVFQPFPTEDEVALRALAALQKEGLLEKGELKLFYFKISEILKTYLGVRYEFDALESTTQELFFVLEEKFTREPHFKAQELLKELFMQLDQVKFTDFVPPLEKSQRLFESIQDWIVLTRKIIRVQDEGKSEVGGESSL